MFGVSIKVAAHRRAEDGGTIVAPFDLSFQQDRESGRLQSRQSSAVVELVESAEAECTFRPVTGHVLRREVMGRQARAVF